MFVPIIFVSAQNNLTYHFTHHNFPATMKYSPIPSLIPVISVPGKYSELHTLFHLNADFSLLATRTT